MSGKVFKGKYDATGKTLRLVEPLEGVADDQTVTFTLVPTPSQEPERPWLKFRGCLSPEDADELAGIIEEEFPTEK